VKVVQIEAKTLYTATFVDTNQRIYGVREEQLLKKRKNKRTARVVKKDTFYGRVHATIGTSVSITCRGAREGDIERAVKYVRHWQPPDEEYSESVVIPSQHLAALLSFAAGSEFGEDPFSEDPEEKWTTLSSVLGVPAVLLEVLVAAKNRHAHKVETSVHRMIELSASASNGLIDPAFVPGLVSIAQAEFTGLEDIARKLKIPVRAPSTSVSTSCVRVRDCVCAYAQTDVVEAIVLVSSGTGEQVRRSPQVHKLMSRLGLNSRIMASLWSLAQAPVDGMDVICQDINSPIKPSVMRGLSVVASDTHKPSEVERFCGPLVRYLHLNDPQSASYVCGFAHGEACMMFGKAAGWIEPLMQRDDQREILASFVSHCLRVCVESACVCECIHHIRTYVT
jgi:hypothetical protein